MECKFTVGQKVVCVDNVPDPEVNPEMHGLLVGSVYTVRDILISPVSNQPAIRVAEIYRFPTRPIADLPYKADRFRPIHETQINELREIAIKAFKSGKVKIDG